MYADFTGSESQLHVVILHHPFLMMPIVVVYPSQTKACEAALEIPPHFRAGFVKVSTPEALTEFIRIVDTIPSPTPQQSSGEPANLSNPQSE